MALNGGLRSGAKLLISSEAALSRSGKPPSNTTPIVFPSRVNCYNPVGFAVSRTTRVSQGFHSTGVKRMGGHGHDSEPYYLHAKHMYNLDRMKHQKLKMSLGVLAAFSIGVAVPVYAVIFQQKKTASG